MGAHGGENFPETLVGFFGNADLPHIEAYAAFCGVYVSHGHFLLAGSIHQDDRAVLLIHGSDVLRQPDFICVQIEECFLPDGLYRRIRRCGRRSRRQRDA